MEWIIDNWYVIFGLVALVLMVLAGIIAFVKMPNAQKIESLKEWLKYAVTEAEKELGSGTGQLKLHYVYDLAIKQFPWVAEIIPFTTFSMWVDDALIWLNKQLQNNKNVENLVRGE